MAFFLEPAGLTEVDNGVFLALLTTPRATAGEVSEDLRLPVNTVRRALAKLVDVGLVTRLVSRPARYVPTPVEPAVDSLVARRQRELERLQVEVRELAARFTSGVPGPGTDLVELIEDADVVQQQAARLQLAARDEVLIVDAPPYATSKPGLNDSELVALARSVPYRTIYHAPVLRDQAHFDEMRRAVAAGEQARSLPVAQMKMLIADGRTAMLPLVFDSGRSTAHLLVRSSPLLSALVGWFEALWARATPIVLDGDTPPPDVHPGPRITERDRRLLTLLASGAQDRAIARTLGVTERTVSRRVSELMTQLSAETRFQAGLQAGRLGWL